MKLFSRVRPKIKSRSTRKDGYSGWLKCPDCSELIHVKDLDKNLYCCTKCNFHHRLTAKERIGTLTDEGSFHELYKKMLPTDPLTFVDSKPYPERIKEAQKKTGCKEGAMVGTATILEQPIALGVLDFSFMGGSMGSVVGEKLTRIIEHAIEHHLPLVIVSASGGARMQESIYSLMQMAKTSAALARLSQQGLPYISILTDPTCGGVTASFATLGDIIIAEPKALICFAGPRVIEQGIKQKLPPDAQKSEFLLEHGLIDCIVPRQELKNKVGLLIRHLTNNSQEIEQQQGVIEGLPKLTESLKELMALSRSPVKQPQ